LGRRAPADTHKHDVENYQLAAESHFGAGPVHEMSAPENDTLDKIDPGGFAQNDAACAVLAWLATRSCATVAACRICSGDR